MLKLRAFNSITKKWRWLNLPEQWVLNPDGGAIISNSGGAPPGFRFISDILLGIDLFLDGSGIALSGDGNGINLTNSTGDVAINISTLGGIQVWGPPNAETLLFSSVLDGTITAGAGYIFPTVDPLVVGAWWDNAGVLTKSDGPLP